MTAMVSCQITHKPVVIDVIIIGKLCEFIRDLLFTYFACWHFLLSFTHL